MSFWSTTVECWNLQVLLSQEKLLSRGIPPPPDLVSVHYQCIVQRTPRLFSPKVPVNPTDWIPPCVLLPNYCRWKWRCYKNTRWSTLSSIVITQTSLYSKSTVLQKCRTMTVWVFSWLWTTAFTVLTERGKESPQNYSRHVVRWWNYGFETTLPKFICSRPRVRLPKGT